MVSNLWDMIHIYCGCHGEDHSIELVPHEGSERFASGGIRGSLFYACPKYLPENRAPGEKACFNRLSIDEYEKMVSELSKKIEGDGFSVVNLTNLKFKNKRGTEFQVLKHTWDRIDVAVINRREAVVK